jgi:hypothetical protein
MRAGARDFMLAGGDAAKSYVTLSLRRTLPTPQRRCHMVGHFRPQRIIARMDNS